VYECKFIVPRAVKQKFQKSMENLSKVQMRNLKEDYSSGWYSLLTIFEITKQNSKMEKLKPSLISGNSL
jgi:hypothetical protein